jgi:SOS response regulatory protein OraA/RecX
MLKREGVDVNTFASSIRLQRKLEQNGLSEEQIESVIENMDDKVIRDDQISIKRLEV